jgi:hypothetical protein
VSYHTPGPWTVHKTTNLRLSFHIRGAASGHLALVFNEADARLIAAAPDLLAALRQAEDLISATFENMTTGDAGEATAELRAIRAAIAKAEGRS